MVQPRRGIVRQPDRAGPKDRRSFGVAPDLVQAETVMQLRERVVGRELLCPRQKTQRARGIAVEYYGIDAASSLIAIGQRELVAHGLPVERLRALRIEDLDGCL